MKSFAERYNYIDNQIVLRSFTDVVNFANFCGATVDVDKCSNSSIRYVLVTQDGVNHQSGGFARAHLLYQKLNELFDLGINIKMSGKTGQLFRLKFDQVPFNQEEKQNEDQQETAKEDSSAGDIQESTDTSESSEATKATEALDDGVRKLTEEELVEYEETLEEVLTIANLPEPDWDEMIPLKMSKKKVKDLAATYGIDLDIKPKYPAMIENFKEAYINLP